MSFVHQRSAGGAQVRSKGSAKNTLIANATMYSGVLGWWPINGMGTFNSLASPTNCTPDPNDAGNPSSMNNIWPNVYKTLTLVWTQDTGPVQTMVYQYQDYCDAPILVTTTTDPGWVEPNGFTSSPAITSTTVRQSYTYPPYSGTGTFVATLSNQFIAATNWASKVASALDLISGVGAGTPGLSAVTVALCPVTAGYIGTVMTTPTGGKYTYGTIAFGTYLCGAVLGLPVRDWNILQLIDPDSSSINPIPALHSIYSVDAPGGGTYPNLGGVIVLASSWILNGTSLGYEPSPVPNNKTIYAQKFDPSTFAMGTVVQPSPDFIANTINYPDPLTSFAVHVNFFPSDVLPNLVAGGVTGASYGIVGFRSAVL